MCTILPNIVKETSRGLESISILDEMLSRREIECVGEINGDSANDIIRQLNFLSHDDPNAEITIYVNSPGGIVSSGLGIYDYMQYISCPIRTVCTGLAASMASIIFAAGDKREMFPHSRIMIHDPLIGGKGLTGSATQLDARVADLMRTREITASILAKHTKRSIEEIYEKTISDTYFYAEEAIAFGLADSIISKER